MMTNHHRPPEKFGTVIGIAPGNVPMYSSDYDSADDEELPTRQSYRSYVDDIYMGHKWQCVEFARRWLYLNCGYVFDDIAVAYDIFRLSTVRNIAENRLLPLRSFRNGSKRWPEPGGKFDDRNQIFQQLFALPKIDGYNVQIGTFTAADRYAGACVRIDESDVIYMESENLALRIVADKEFSPPEQRDQ